MGEIIEIGDMLIQRKKENPRFINDGKGCDHTNLVMDDAGHIVTCSKCGIQLEAYWALKMLTEQYERWRNRFNQERAEHKEEVKTFRQENIHLIAARMVEKAWRARGMVPSCPHCHAGILPEDGLGKSLINREMEMRRRKTKRQKDSTGEGSG